MSTTPPPTVCASGFLPDLCPALTLPLARTEGRPNKSCLFGEIRGLEHFLAHQEGSHSDGIVSLGEIIKRGVCRYPCGQGREESPGDRDASSREPDSPAQGGLLHSGGRAQVQHTHKRPQDPAAPAEPQELRAESRRDVCAGMFTAALLRTAPSEEPPSSRPVTGGRKRRSYRQRV